MRNDIINHLRFTPVYIRSVSHKYLVRAQGIFCYQKVIFKLAASDYNSGLAKNKQVKICGRKSHKHTVRIPNIGTRTYENGMQRLLTF